MVKIEPPQPLTAGTVAPSSDHSVSHTVDQLHVTRHSHSALCLHILKQCVFKEIGLNDRIVVMLQLSNE